MARINEAWHTLSDPTRRARWDQRHGGAFAEPTWTAAPAAPYSETAPRPVAQPAASPTRFDSGWATAALVAGLVVVVGVVMVGIAIATGPADERVALQTSTLSLLHESNWVRAVGDGDDPPEHRVVAHLATWNADPDRSVHNVRARPAASKRRPFRPVRRSSSSPATKGASRRCPIR